MITIFTTAKPFRGDHKIRQLNALKSWKALHPDVEIILFGTGDGYVEVSKELGLVHIPDVDVSDKGTPLVNAMFARAEIIGQYSLQAYVNCDIILLDDFIKAAQTIHLDRFMMVGHRWDLDISEEMDIKNPLWEEQLRHKLHPENLHPPAGSDYFLYRRGTWKNLPSLVAGRARFDNWLIYYCRLNHINVIDASEVVTIIHQNHDYSHLKQGLTEVCSGSEAKINLDLFTEGDPIFTLVDSDWRLTSKGLSRNYCRGDWKRLLWVYLILHKKSLWGGWSLRFLKTLSHSINS